VENHRENEIGVSLLRIQSERPSSTRFQETQLLCLAGADVEDPHNHCFDMHDLKLSVRYEHWRLLLPKVLQGLTTTLSQEFTNPEEHSVTLLRIHIKPLPKKAGGRDIRPISLIETTVKLIDKMYLPKLRLGQAHTFQSSQSNMDSGQECQLQTK